jgi:glycerol-3-phosphate cytidylyltransferase-like family protein
VIVPTEELGSYAGAVTMVDGGFDPLHHGHIAYFRSAAELGLPVLCNLAPDEWIERKHPPLLAQSDRATVVDSIRWIDYVHLATGTTAEVLRVLRPRFYAKGVDWKGRVPVEEQEVCAQARVEIVYLDTVVASSTAIYRRVADG